MTSGRRDRTSPASGGSAGRRRIVGCGPSSPIPATMCSVPSSCRTRMRWLFQSTLSRPSGPMVDVLGGGRGAVASAASSVGAVAGDAGPRHGADPPGAGSAGRPAPAGSDRVAAPPPPRLPATAGRWEGAPRSARSRRHHPDAVVHRVGDVEVAAAVKRDAPGPLQGRRAARRRRRRNGPTPSPAKVVMTPVAGWTSAGGIIGVGDVEPAVGSSATSRGQASDASGGGAAVAR